MHVEVIKVGVGEYTCHADVHAEVLLDFVPKRRNQHGTASHIEKVGFRIRIIQLQNFLPDLDERSPDFGCAVFGGMGDKTRRCRQTRGQGQGVRQRRECIAPADPDVQIAGGVGKALHMSGCNRIRRAFSCNDVVMAALQHAKDAAGRQSCRIRIAPDREAQAQMGMRGKFVLSGEIVTQGVKVFSRHACPVPRRE